MEGKRCEEKAFDAKNPYGQIIFPLANLTPSAEYWSYSDLLEKDKILLYRGPKQVNGRKERFQISVIPDEQINEIENYVEYALVSRHKF